MKAPLFDLAIIGNSRISALIDREDDFGIPSTGFIVCTFWLIQALVLQGDHWRARQQFEKLLARRNRLRLLSEDIAIKTGELWGTFPQTYSMVCIIMCAKRLSSRWDETF